MKLQETDRIPFPFLGDQPRLESGQGAGVDLRLAWNPKGIGLELTVTGRKLPVLSQVDYPTRADSLQIWIDTRNTQNVHRATRFCHSFCLLPRGGGDKGEMAMAVQVPVSRAQSDAPMVDEDPILIQSTVDAKGYRLEAWIPKESLHGFDPVQQPLLGFFCCLNDAELGRIPLAHGAEFPFESDPTLWESIELKG
ncbi:MAG: hypothetical protein R3C01_13970 [Planctomycetaceae bacterium]